MSKQAEQETRGATGVTVSEFELRVHRRVGVGLRIAVVLDRETAYMARTENVSEGGLLVRDYRGPRLASGRVIGVNIRGVISDAGDDDASQYLMRVVRHSGENIALRFIES